MDTKLLLVILLPLVTSMQSPDVFNSDEMCPESETSCTFLWTVENRQTMMQYDGVLAHPVVWRNGAFWARYHCSDTTNDVKLNESDLNDKFLHTADGTYKYIQTINKMFPGPTVVAYEGQEIVINVTNHFWQQGTGVHWHGFVQKKTNWMDGVPGVTQCAINPQETFQYRFIAEPAGTHWYHSHQGLQRGDGYFGAFIVLPKGYKTAKPNDSPKMAGNGDPLFHKDYIMMVSDWFPGESNLAMTSFMNDLKQYMFDGWNKTGTCFGGSKKAPNGVSAATFRYNSALFNGKGYLYDANDKPTVPVPLETYTVGQNQYIRFRVINAASAYAFMISVDGHKLTVISSDGQDIEPIETDYIVVNAGERFDFYIYTNNTVNNYWIRSTTLEWEPHEAHAIVRYAGAAMTNPTTSASCGVGCTVVNCPFPSFIRGPFMNATCTNFESIKSRTNSAITVSNLNEFEEHFIAWEKTSSPYNRKYDTCNGVMFRPPSTPPTVVGTVKYDLNCANHACANGPCDCTNQIQLGLNNVVQLVFLANTTHPIHLHGHYFEVIKVGYAPPGHDNTTFKSLMSNQDIVCNNAFCNKAAWRNVTWNQNNVPGTNTVNPARKDTITIPANGYVVVRFVASNPGWWMMHCHIETHMLQGMAIILQSGADHQMNPPPKGFHTCGSYGLTGQQFRDALNGQQTTTPMMTTTTMKPDMGWTTRERNLAFGYIGAVIGGIILGIIIHICFQNCRSSDD